MGHLIVLPVLLGEGEGLADKAPGVLAQGVVPALHVRGLPGLLAGTPQKSRTRRDFIKFLWEPIFSLVSPKAG